VGWAFRLNRRIIAGGYTCVNRGEDSKPKSLWVFDRRFLFDLYKDGTGPEPFFGAKIFEWSGPVPVDAGDTDKGQCYNTHLYKNKGFCGEAIAVADQLVGDAPQ